MFLAINQNAFTAKKRKKEKEPVESNTIMSAGITEMETETETIAVPTMTGTVTSSTAQLVDDKMRTALRDNGNVEMLDNDEVLATAMANVECRRCRHALRNGHCDRHYQNDRKQTEHQQQQQQQQQQEQQEEANKKTTDLLRVPCHCDCDCIHKTSSYTHVPPTTAPISERNTRVMHSSVLCGVYVCLVTLAIGLTTLAALFYAHVYAVVPSTTTTATPSPAINSKIKHTEAADANVAFREQFRHELIASEHVLRDIVMQMLRQQDNQQRHQQYQHQQQQQTMPTIADTGALHNLQLQQQQQRQQHQQQLSSYPETIVTTESTLYDEVEDVRNERKRNVRHYAADRVTEMQRIRRDIASSSPSSMHADTFIEFFDPNHRKVLEEQDMEIRKRTGLKGAAPGGDNWVYLNTYCRVPEKIITGFCKGTQEYCPPGPKGATGPPGLPGIPGPKGNRGDVGLRGPKGDIGIPGRSGLDGRDGVPGEPGLDGVPGRAGADGIPGKDGMAGRDGRDGKDGKDGKDGVSGPKGAQGPPGERGLKGIAGPRGRPGKSGVNGTPGIPGINAWKVQLQNGSYSNDLLIPPSIADINAPHIQRTVIVEEGKTLNLSCAATGNPMPQVEWRRDDGRTINIHGMEMSSVSGQFLKFNNITRNQMAAYTCFADNGLAPVANATFLIEVHFSPMIAVYRQMIYAEYGHSATLECLVEAFPEAIRYWERAYDGKILDPGEKYRIETYPDGFKTTMRLTINNLRKDDFGYYHCVARNELNATMVNFDVEPQDPNSETPYVGKEIKVYGQRPPESECPICEQCPDPGIYQCKDSINNNFEIQPTGNYSYPGLPKRHKSCLLYAVGKPVFHKFLNEHYGSWMKDSAAKEIDREKTFVTNDNDFFSIFEFSTKTQYRLNSVPRRKYEVRDGFQGNAHVVYNGSFYYNQRNTDLVVKLDLITLKKITTQLPHAGIAAGNKLYSTDYNYMDFNVDEVGLWVIYSTYDSNNTLVAKLDAENLKMQYNFNITLDHRKFGEMFIVCGHLYAIDSCTEKNSQIRYVVDLYNGKLLNVDLPFSNPFRKTTSVGYNPFAVELYSWDRGNALTYPIRYHEHTLISEHIN